MPSLYRVIRLETGQEIDTGKFSSTLDAIGLFLFVRCGLLIVLAVS